VNARRSRCYRVYPESKTRTELRQTQRDGTSEAMFVFDTETQLIEHKTQFWKLSILGWVRCLKRSVLCRRSVSQRAANSERYAAEHPADVVDEGQPQLALLIVVSL